MIFARTAPPSRERQRTEPADRPLVDVPVESAADPNPYRAPQTMQFEVDLVEDPPEKQSWKALVWYLAGCGFCIFHFGRQFYITGERAPLALAMVGVLFFVKTAILLIRPDMERTADRIINAICLLIVVTCALVRLFG
jgi:hypothetical protein